jgi:hypothetical protein
MRWKVLGVAARDERINVRIALRVVAPDGKTAFDEPNYAVVDDTLFYRPPTLFLPISGHLTLPSGAPKGVYTGHFEVSDNVAGVRIEHTAKLCEVR